MAAMRNLDEPAMRLRPDFRVRLTRKFAVFEAPGASDEIQSVSISIDDPYTRRCVAESFLRRGTWGCFIAHGDAPTPDTPTSGEATATHVHVQWREYTQIDWTAVLGGRVMASSYCVRKGLARKAQLHNTIRRFVVKAKGPVALRAAVPISHVIETWEAFEEDISINLSGDVAAFGAGVLSLPQRLSLCIEDAIEAMTSAPEGTVWILKPSYANKGAEIVLVTSVDELKEHLMEWSVLREWVLQRYIPNPLLFRGRKFHLRAYVLAVGAIKT